MKISEIAKESTMRAKTADGAVYAFAAIRELEKENFKQAHKLSVDLHNKLGTLPRCNDLIELNRNLLLFNMCVACDDGVLNIRVGAIIMKDGKILMVGNDRDYLYSVGGRVKFGETAEEAVVREVLEETGVQMEIDRLGFVHENYFYGDVPSNRNKLIYEISLFFYMKVPDAFAPISESFMEDNSKEHLVWASLDEDIKMYPEFFKTELKNPTDTVSGSSRARVLEPQAGHKIQCSLFEFMVHLALY